MLDVTEFERWRNAADQAQSAAQVQARSGFHNWACFLAEQAAQLAVKGLLHGIGAGAWGHDLVELGRLLSEALGESVPDTVRAAFQRLSRHYIPARYPNAHPSGTPGAHYGEEDVDQALADLGVTTQFVALAWRELTLADEASGES